MIAESAQNSLQSFVFLSLRALSACSFAPPKLAGRLPAAVSPESDGFTSFETEPVRPLAPSADGSFLYALNTADDRLARATRRYEQLRSGKIGERFRR